MIVIKNLRYEKIKEPYQVRVDRGTPLGNPYPLFKEPDRPLVIAKYKEWLLAQGPDTEAYRYLQGLLKLYRVYGRLELFCWCAPKECHAKHIKAFLDHYLEGYND